jgi:hypothetical protein
VFLAGAENQQYILGGSRWLDSQGHFRFFVDLSLSSLLMLNLLLPETGQTADSVRRIVAEQVALRRKEIEIDN